MVIEDPPERPICSRCNEKLIWLYSARRSRWVAFIILAGRRLEPHTCDARQRMALHLPDPTAARRNARGRALANATLAGQPIDDKETTTR